MNHEIHVALEPNALFTPPRDGDVGYDLHSTERIWIYPSQTVLIGTGVTMALPPELYAEIRDRSSIATNRGLQVVAGIIDPGYRGRIIVALYNGTEDRRPVDTGDKIAQMIFHEVITPKVLFVGKILSDTERGDKGFGSTGG